MTARSVVATVAIALVVVTATATPSLARVPRAAAVPATPVLAMPLKEGITEQQGLSASQKAKVTADVRWLQDRFNVLLGRIKWTEGAIRADGVFDAKTTRAVVYFKTWANTSRKLLHMTPLFPTIGGVVGQSTVGVVAIVGAYFQLHPPLHYADPDSIAGLERYQLDGNDLSPLVKEGGDPPPAGWYWSPSDSFDSENNGLDLPCTVGSPIPEPWAGQWYHLGPDSTGEGRGSYLGAARTMVYHFKTADEVDRYMATHRGSTHDNCVRDTSMPESLADNGLTLVGAATFVGGMPSIGSNSIGRRWNGQVRSDTGQCSFFSDSYIVAVGLTVLLADFNACQYPWSKASEAAILTKQANRLLIPG